MINNFDIHFKIVSGEPTIWASLSQKTLGIDIDIELDVAFAFRRPDTPVVAQTFAHQRELRLILAGDRDARRVDLRVAGVREKRAFFVGAIRGGDVATLGVG